MDEETKKIFDEIVQSASLVFQIKEHEIRDALFELQSFDKLYMMCFISKEIGIPLWEVIQEGKEPMNHYYNKAQEEIQELWSAGTVH